MRRADLKHAICLDCGYRLHGLCEPRCPECGRAFDPENPNTFLDQQRPKVWFHDVKQAGFWVFWAKPPPMWHVLVALLVTLIFLESTSIGGGFWGVFAVSSYPRVEILLLCGYCLLPVYGVSILSYVFRIIGVRRAWVGHHGDDGGKRYRWTWRWLSLPISIAIILSACVYPWPLRLRFSASRASFERIVKAVQAGATINTGAQRIGWYYVASVENDGQRILFIVGDNTIDPVAFVYDPAGEPTFPGTPLITGSVVWQIEEQ